MLGLRRWHIVLLTSELGATFVVLWAYRDIISARQGPHDLAHLMAGLGGALLLVPGSKLLFWMKYPPLSAICVAAAVAYTAVFYFFATAICLFFESELFRIMQSARITDIEQNDLTRYLR